jgi:ethanolamine utilization cobalamin adenosyltransferase
MDFVYQYADEVVLLNKGKVVTREDKVTFFNQDYLSKYNIEKPQIIEAYERLTSRKADKYITFESLIKEIVGEVKDVK